MLSGLLEVVLLLLLQLLLFPLAPPTTSVTVEAAARQVAAAVAVAGTGGVMDGAGDVETARIVVVVAASVQLIRPFYSLPHYSFGCNPMTVVGHFSLWEVETTITTCYGVLLPVVVAGAIHYGTRPGKLVRSLCTRCGACVNRLHILLRLSTAFLFFSFVFFPLLSSIHALFPVKNPTFVTSLSRLT